MTGTVRKVLQDKGFGFIISNGKEFFFHRNHFTGNWNQLCLDVSNNKIMRVQFEEVTSNKGPRAEHVMVMVPGNPKFDSLDGN